MRSVGAEDARNEVADIRKEHPTLAADVCWPRLPLTGWTDRSEGLLVSAGDEGTDDSVERAAAMRTGCYSEELQREAFFSSVFRVCSAGLQLWTHYDVCFCLCYRFEVLVYLL